MKESPEALFNTDAVATADAEVIGDLKRRALRSPSRRFRLCLHHSAGDMVQEMIVVHCRDNYSRPHCHPGLASTCVMLEGELSVFLFDERGSVSRRIDLAAPGSGRPFTLRIGPDQWHMPVCTTPQAVFFENMQGPFERERVNRWAPWSPDESDADGILTLRRRLGVDFGD